MTYRAISYHTNVGEEHTPFTGAPETIEWRVVVYDDNQYIATTVFFGESHDNWGEQSRMSRAQDAEWPSELPKPPTWFDEAVSRFICEECSL